MTVILNFLSKASGVLFGKEIMIEDQALLFRGISRSILVQVASYVLVFASSILFVRVAGINNYGVYVNIFNWIGVLSIMACAGMEDIVLSDIPGFLKSGQKGYVRQLILFTNKTILVVSFICVIVFGLIVLSGAVKGFSENKFLFLGALINIYFLAFIVLNQQILQAFNLFYSSQITDKILKPFLIVCFLTGCWIMHVNMNADWLIFGNTAILFICCIALFFMLRKPLEGIPALKSEKLPLTEISEKGGYFLLISLLFLLKSKIGMLVIGSFGNTAGVGIFNIVYRLADFVLLPYLLIHNVVPQLFSSHLNTDSVYKKKLFRKSTYLLTIGSLLIYLLIIFLGKPLLRIYNVQLEENYIILIILCGSQFLYSLFGPSISFLMMQGAQKQAAIALLADITVNCLLLFFLMNKFGIAGAAWAALAGSLFYNIILRILVERLLKKNIQL